MNVWLLIGLVGSLLALATLGMLRKPAPRAALLACIATVAAADAGLAVVFCAPVARVAVAGAIAGAIASPRVAVALGTGHLRPSELFVLLTANCAAMYVAICLAA